MNTYDEIRIAAVNLPPWERTLLAAELFAEDESEPDSAELEAALERGLADVRAGAVRPMEEVRALLPQWLSKS